MIKINLLRNRVTDGPRIDRYNHLVYRKMFAKAVYFRMGSDLPMARLWLICAKEYRETHGVSA